MTISDGQESLPVLLNWRIKTNELSGTLAIAIFGATWPR